ncbi:SDR family NAD(P)-dependent oxidoreductase [Streptomyces sp. NPDC001985]|uniref:SDR family NAD(P)-dependent oxidoreductase n=1 Tax=Streptomyces sp. NPDC001985 TaxID=3154406 RepID=UPI00331E6397
MSLVGKAFLVTGAGSGIGSATAAALVRSGADVVVLGRRAQPLHALRTALGASGAPEHGRVAVVPADVGAAGTGERALAAALESFGRLDGLVNNAGLARFAPIDEAAPDDLDAMFTVNVSGPVRLIRACLPQLRQHRGSVVNVSSVGGVLSMPGRSLYGATKAALNSLTRSLARELAPTVRVNALLPGPVETPMYDDLGLGPERTARLREDLVAATPMGRFGGPDEVARWVCHLLDDASGWVTGALIPIDGGRTA